MPANPDLTGYKIWAVDNVIYGPAELPVLVNWIKEERVTADTWVYSEKDDAWQKACQLPELKMFFSAKSPVRSSAAAAASRGQSAISEMGTQVIRRIKVLAGMSEEQLARFLQFIELQTVRQWTTIVKQGDPGDGMFLVLEGEVRVRMMIGNKETILATLSGGDFFGEISLFDHGPRSADVIANTDCLLLKISVASFQKLASEAPDLTTPFLVAMGRTLTGRIRADNKRFREVISFMQLSGN